MGESLPPPFLQRLLTEGLLWLAGLCAAGAVALLLAEPGAGFPVASALLGGGALGLVALALRREARLERRRFVLHFASYALRLERLAWAPSATRGEWVPFSQVCAVEAVERAPGHYALLVVWRSAPEAPEQRALLVEAIGRSEEEALLRVWRLLCNAFGLKGAGLA